MVRSPVRREAIPCLAARSRGRSPFACSAPIWLRRPEAVSPRTMECCRASQKLGQRAPPFGLEVQLSHCRRYATRRNDRIRLAVRRSLNGPTARTLRHHDPCWRTFRSFESNWPSASLCIGNPQAPRDCHEGQIILRPVAVVVRGVIESPPVARTLPAS